MSEGVLSRQLYLHLCTMYAQQLHQMLLALLAGDLLVSC